jgi:hypothetical protein
MKFTTHNASEKFDFSIYDVSELRTAIQIVSTFSMTGAHSLITPKVRELAETMRATQGMTAHAMVYVREVGHLAVRTITPFNLQAALSERYSSYVCNETLMEVEKLQVPFMVGFPNYKDKEVELKSLLPGTRLVPFDAIFSLNVSVVAAFTRYAADKGQGKVVPVTPPTALYEKAPHDAAAFCSTFEVNGFGALSMSGLEWAHYLYQRFWDTRLEFMQTVYALIRIPLDVSSGNPKIWSKTYSPLLWPADKPINDEQRLECLNRMQVYRSKDNAGISAMTYGIYGEQFGPQYKLVEKMGYFEIFLRALPEVSKKYPIRYISKDEKELICAQNLMLEYGFKQIHFHERPLNGIAPMKTGYNVYAEQIVFLPKCVTAPFSGKLTKDDVKRYMANNVERVVDRISRYASAVHFGFKAHVLGLEDHTLGLPTPHNAVGTMMLDKGRCTQQEIWTLIMIAGLCRNTYLYHRKPLSFFLARVLAMNTERAAKGEAVTRMMGWKPLRRPAWYAFTKEQRKRTLTLLRDCEMFGDIPDDIADEQLVLMVEKAQSSPAFQAHLVKSMEGDVMKNAEYDLVVKGHVKAPVVPQVPVSMVGDDLVEMTEIPRAKIVLKSSAPVPQKKLKVEKDDDFLLALQRKKKHKKKKHQSYSSSSSDSRNDDDQPVLDEDVQMVLAVKKSLEGNVDVKT